MKKIFTIILIIACNHVFAQDSLKNFDYQRYRATTTGMEVLGSWAIANIGVGAVGWADSKGGSNRFFYQMNVLWNAANLGAAILGYTSAQKDKNKILTQEESLKAQQKIEKIFLVNGSLDLVYIGAGIFLKDRGDTRNSDQLKGYGSSIIIQGVFLLLFDGTMYSTHKNNGSKLRRFLEKNPMTFDGRRVGIMLNI